MNLLIHFFILNKAIQSHVHVQNPDRMQINKTEKRTNVLYLLCIFHLKTKKSMCEKSPGESKIKRIFSFSPVSYICKQHFESSRQVYYFCFCAYFSHLSTTFLLKVFLNSKILYQKYVGFSFIIFLKVNKILSKNFIFHFMVGSVYDLLAQNVKISCCIEDKTV